MNPHLRLAIAAILGSASFGALAAGSGTDADSGSLEEIFLQLTMQAPA